PLAEISPTGLLSPRTNGTGKVLVSMGGKTAEISLAIGGQTKRWRADFVRDVSPVLSRVGCNAGTCHGAKEGKNGFKLSLRGYDPETDVRALTDDLASRRVNIASPEDRKSTRLNSSHVEISYAVFCLKNKNVHQGL